MKQPVIRKRNLQPLRRIHGGGMAQLKLAVAPDGKHYVIRELHPDRVMNWRVRQQFAKGLRIRERLCPHDHIVCPYHHATLCVRPYEILEYVHGKNLHEIVSKDVDTIRQQALHVMRSVAEALNYMHERGIAHLDVKAENVLVAQDGDEAELQVKLTDFDLSRCMKSGGHLRSGTASYMAPEQLAKGRVSLQNDIFAFGVMAYYLVTRRMPFSAYSLDEVRRQQVSARFEITPPRKLYPDLAPKLNSIICSCLEKDPAKRFPSMAYLLQELRRV